MKYLAAIFLFVAVPALANTENIEIDNADVRVTKVTIDPGATFTPRKVRGKRVMVWLNDQCKNIKSVDAVENKQRCRNAGSVGFFQPSKGHSITNTDNVMHTSLIIELKH